MPRVECPSCSANLEVDAFGDVTECPRCEAFFRALPVSELEAIQPTAFDYFFSETFFPSNHAERMVVLAQAYRRVQKPGTGLMVTGFLGIAITTIIGLFVVLATIDDLQRGRGRRSIAPEQIGTIIAINFYFFLMLVGGRQLKRLENRGFCQCIAVLSSLGILVCGGWLIISTPAMVFGTLAFVALESWEVKHAMRWKQLERNDRT